MKDYELKDYKKYLKKTIEEDRKSEKRKKGNIKTFLKKPKVKLPKYSAERAIMKGLPDKARLVSEGETGYFKKEYEKESKWLSK